MRHTNRSRSLMTKQLTNIFPDTNGAAVTDRVSDRFGHNSQEHMAELNYTCPQTHIIDQVINSLMSPTPPPPVCGP